MYEAERNVVRCRATRRSNRDNVFLCPLATYCYGWTKYCMTRRNALPDAKERIVWHRRLVIPDFERCYPSLLETTKLSGNSRTVTIRDDSVCQLVYTFDCTTARVVHVTECCIPFQGCGRATSNAGFARYTFGSRF